MSQSSYKTCTGKTPFDFMKFKWAFIAVSVFFVLFSLYEIGINGINFGVDFVGGTKMIYQFPKDATAEEIRGITSKLDLGDVQVIQFGNNPAQNQFMVRAKYKDGQNVDQVLTRALTERYGSEDLKILSKEVVGPKVGADMQKKGSLAVLFTCLFILIYVGFRFDFLFSPGAVVALIHDVVISVGFFSLFNKEFSLPILAALLTIIGYSINDTIVIYDRIRENIGRLPKNAPALQVINISVTETLGRTIVTSLTVLLVVLALYFLGGGVLHDFAFCLLIGIVFGTYSSIFIASPFYLFLQRLFPGKGIKEAVPAS
ncbi:MAG: protein translocase subunit SecF [Deltaproteobacteria bacterium]|nr:protein translocase subunit SecF [Deltaproteobacteria bacterium]